MTMGAEPEGFTPECVRGQYVDLGQPWPATSDVQGLPGNPNGSRNGANIRRYDVEAGLVRQLFSARA